MKTVRLLNEAGNKVVIKIKNRNIEEANFNNNLLKIKNKNVEEDNSKTSTVTKFKGISVDVFKNTITQELVLTKTEAHALLGILQEFLA